ncbi:hypothetical protein ASD55_17735 [Rhodanobacter sp. Root561]|nr:hypothetical protein ASD55_17735 [Rhodanobacter sp. Root561]
MSQATKILILIASFLPLLLGQVFAFLLLSKPVGGHPWLEDNVGYLVLSLVVFQATIAAFFIWHLRSCSKVPPGQRTSWVLQFLFLPLGVVNYWYKHMWRVNGHAL